MDKETAVRIILAMKRNYGNKADKHLINKEIQKLAEEYNITYGDIGDFQKSHKYNTILKRWIKNQ